MRGGGGNGKEGLRPGQAEAEEAEWASGLGNSRPMLGLEVGKTV